MKKTINAEVRKANKRGKNTNGECKVSVHYTALQIEITTFATVGGFKEKLREYNVNTEDEAIEIIANLWND